MENKILGIHHITAIAGSAKRNYDFYTRVLGLRLLKKTVNFDDPYTYHLYYGDEQGSPGTILTFFPYEQVNPGRRGTGMATEIGYAVPADSFDFWIDHFDRNGVIYNKPAEKFGEKYLTFLDPDGLKLELTVSKAPDARKPWTTDEVGEAYATRGFHHTTITLEDVKPTARVLTEVLGYRLAEQHVNRYRYVCEAGSTAAIIDLVEAKGEQPGFVAGGAIHHIAFRVKNEEVLMEYQERVRGFGLSITPKIDRNYFYSLYFREPGGVLFEIATDNPGFAIDEQQEALGQQLKLPPQHEPLREKLLQRLPAIP
ncbi:ring-cleaving dioxygenase [Cesiribacter sp. SM1]|uniref:ring-cleaving dioxygenase n=1 Tax=Cesiribacter sp. SM1 TaxID=2861196 RepID=UPI001CD633B5|nr:ring-cleaving dioxygenase [Cesiribacter sp. SM1]